MVVVVVVIWADVAAAGEVAAGGEADAGPGVEVAYVAGILLVVHSELGALGEVGGERAVVLLRGDGGGVQVVEDSPQLHLLLLYSLEGDL